MYKKVLGILIKLSIAGFAHSATICPVLITKIEWPAPSPYYTRRWSSPMFSLTSQGEGSGPQRYTFLSNESYSWVTIKNRNGKKITHLELTGVMIRRDGYEKRIPFGYSIDKIKGHKSHVAILPMRLSNSDEFDAVRMQVSRVEFDDGSSWVNSASQDCTRPSR
jgi:hypothetical protein